MFLVLRKAGIMDPTGKTFPRDGESLIRCLYFLMNLPMLGKRGLKTSTMKKWVWTPWAGVEATFV